MRLVTDHSLAAGAVSVQCLACGKTLPLADAIIDTGGPAFRAYYHRSCLPAGSPPPEPCGIDGCRRPH